MSLASTDSPRRHRLTVSDYYRMAEVGILAPDARVELIDGDIIDMVPPGTLHATTVDRLSGILVRSAGNQAWVRVARGSARSAAGPPPCTGAGDVHAY
jgi:Uma2 family endonuclease